MLEIGKTIDFGSFGVSKEFVGGDYDATITAFEGDRAGWDPTIPVLKTQFTIDNGEFKGKSVVLETILTYQGAPDQRAFQAINTFAHFAGMDLQGRITWIKNPIDFAEQFQKILAEQGDDRYRLSVRVGFDYKIDGQYKKVVGGKKRNWTADDYENAAGDKSAFPKVLFYDGSFGPAQAEAEIQPTPLLPDAVDDPLSGAFGEEDPATSSPGTSPGKVDNLVEEDAPF